AKQASRQQQAICGLASENSGNIDAMVAVGTVDRAEDRVTALGLEETQADIDVGHGHAVARLMAGGASSSVAAQALEKRSGFINSPIQRAVGLRGAAKVREGPPVGNEVRRISAQGPGYH